MLKADNLSLSLGNRAILHNVSASFERGKINIIMGPNGAGKSTFLHAIAGLRQLHKGDILLDGAPIKTLSDRDRAQRIGLLPQSGELHWDLKVGELVALGRMPYQGRFGKDAGDDIAIESALSATDTAQYLGRTIGNLSGGERARVLLARVLAGQPDWLLADEPLANLDPGHQLDLLDLLRAQADSGTGVIAVLHDLSLAARIADHIILMDAGRMIASGSTEHVLTAKNIETVYGVTASFSRDEHGHNIITPLSRT